jgi:hypothetical protein
VTVEELSEHSTQLGCATILGEDRVDAASGEISEEVTVLEASEGSGPRLECVQSKLLTR